MCFCCIQVADYLSIHICNRCTFKILILNIRTQLDRYSKLCSCGGRCIRFAIQIDKHQIIGGTQIVKFSLHFLHFCHLRLRMGSEQVGCIKYHVTVVDDLICQIPQFTLITIIRNLAILVDIEILLPGEIREHLVSIPDVVRHILCCIDVLLQLITHKVYTEVIIVFCLKIGILVRKQTLWQKTIAYHQFLQVIYSLYSS